MVVTTLLSSRIIFCHYLLETYILDKLNWSIELYEGVILMKTKDNFLEGAKVTKDNQIYGTPNSKAKDGTGDSPNDNVGKKKRNK